MSAVKPAHSGSGQRRALRPHSSCPSSTMRLPVDGSESALTSGTWRPLPVIELPAGPCARFATRGGSRHRPRRLRLSPLGEQRLGPRRLADVVTRGVSRQGGAAGAGHRRQGRRESETPSNEALRAAGRQRQTMACSQGHRSPRSRRRRSSPWLRCRGITAGVEGLQIGVVEGLRCSVSQIPRLRLMTEPGNLSARPP